MQDTPCETNSNGSEILPGSQALQTLCREKDPRLMEGLNRGQHSVQPPGPPPHDRDPEEDPAGLREDPGAEEPLDPHRESLSPRKPLPDPCPRDPASSDTGKLCQIRGSKLVTSQGSALRATSVQRHRSYSETRHGEHTGIRSPGINQMPWGTWRKCQRNLSTPREEQRKEDTWQLLDPRVPPRALSEAG